MRSRDDLMNAVEGIVHEETQISDSGLDLSVADIYDIDDPGRVDFGGGELTNAAVSSREKHWRTDDDEYQWWHLDAGQYLIEYNEGLSVDEPVILQTRSEILERGVFHPSLRVTRLPRVPLSVGTGGIRLKENARVSTLLCAPRSD